MINFAFRDIETGQTFETKAENEDEAFEKAREHFGEIAEEGRWEEENKGEDENFNVVYVEYRLNRPLHVVYFECRHHPGDSRLIGVYSTNEKAKAAVKNAIESDARSYPNHPRREEQDEWSYKIETSYIDE